jgi:hypothetical protein
MELDEELGGEGPVEVGPPGGGVRGDAVFEIKGSCFLKSSYFFECNTG